MIDIWWKTGDRWSGLSNLAYREFRDDLGTLFYCVEHAYQCWKSGVFDPVTHRKYTFAGRKIVGRYRAKTLNNWNIRLMDKCIRRSFEADEDARMLLLDTGDEILTHRNDRGIWATEFPRILMEVRSDLRI